MKKHLIHFGFIFHCCFFCSFNLIADEPPDWQPYFITSMNNEWVAYLSPEKPSEQPWREVWKISVFNQDKQRFPSVNATPAWSREFQPSGYPEGLLSNDGQVFAKINFWYVHSVPLVSIYRKECQRDYFARSFVLPKNMPTTASHQIWLDSKQFSQFVVKDKKMMLIIPTLMGIREISIECEV